MDGRKIILLVGALIVAAITAFMARSLMAGGSAPATVAAQQQQPVVAGKQVLVATKALPVGTILDPSAIKFQPWPNELVTDAYYLRDNTDVKSLQGTVVRYAVPAGQPLTQGSLVKPGERGFLAAALTPGMRAVTVPVDSQSAVAGFVLPGDRVDLVLTQSVEGGGDGPPLKVSETVLRNLRVLATDQRTSNEVDDEGKPVVHPYSTVTVEATPKIAEKVALAQTLGSLSLSLRPLADNSTELEQAIASGRISVPDGDDSRAESQMLASADTQPLPGDSYSTGADVSRFQRRTVPGKSDDRQSANFMTRPASGTSSAPQARSAGPVVRVARGNAVTEVPVEGKN